VRRRNSSARDLPQANARDQIQMTLRACRKTRVGHGFDCSTALAIGSSAKVAVTLPAAAVSGR